MLRRRMLRAARDYAQATLVNLAEDTDESLEKLAVAERRLEALAIEWVEDLSAEERDRIGREAL